MSIETTTAQIQPVPEVARLSALRGWIMAGLLGVVTLIAYFPALQGQFILDYATPVRSYSWHADGWQALGQIWTHSAPLLHHAPLADTTLWIDHRFWGDWTLPYHLESILLHFSATMLFWRLLVRLKVPGAGLAAAITALHPIMAESAGWLVERGNLLSLFFSLCALLSYGRFAMLWPQKFSHLALEQLYRWFSYGISMLFFLAALLSSTIAAIVPVLILFIIGWKRGALRWKRDDQLLHDELVPVLPFFAILAAHIVWLKMLPGAGNVDATGVAWDVSLPDRFLLAGRAFWFYAGHLLWPVSLCFIYPRWENARFFGMAGLGLIGVMATLIILWRLSPRIGRGAAVAVTTFALTVLLVMLLMSPYDASYSFVADRWAYLAVTPLIALASAAMTTLAERFRKTAWVQGLAVVAISLLALQTWNQASQFTDTETILRRAVLNNPASSKAREGLAALLLLQELHEEAAEQYQMILTMQPDHAEAHNNLGNALLKMGQPDEAISHYEKALEINPKFTDARYNLGGSLLQKGQLAEASSHFETVLQIKPDHEGARINLGLVFFRQGKIDDAIKCYKEVLTLHPNSSEAYNNLGNAFFQKARPQDAIPFYNKALSIRPDNAEAHLNLGNVHLLAGNIHQALVEFEKSLGTNAKQPGLLNLVAWILATCPDEKFRDGPKAVRFAEKLNGMSPVASPLHLHTLAASYAEVGRYADALQVADKALALASAQDDKNMINAIRQERAFYVSQTPVRDAGILQR